VPPTSPLRSRAWARFLGPPLLLAFAIVVTLVISEGFFTLLLARAPLLRWLPATTVSHVRRLYLAHDRNLIQAMPGCARYDPELFYTLEPGKFRFRNREFDTAFRVNHLGLRDTESALRSPEVVVLGDSYAMGWGVEQDETVARLIERDTGRRALNAGVAGYGTVREMRLLDRIDARALRYLVIQYCDDDVIETVPFARDGTFEVGDAREYRQDVHRAERRKRYWFGRRTYEFLRDVISPEPDSRPSPLPPDAEARLFVNAVLQAGRTNLSRARLVVFEVRQSRVIDGAFVLAVRKEIAAERYPAWIRDMIALDLEGHLRPAHYYDLDDHLRAEGQAAIAAAVTRVIQEDAKGS
jgi:hypothetical protein